MGTTTTTLVTMARLTRIDVPLEDVPDDELFDDIDLGDVSDLLDLPLSLPIYRPQTRADCENVPRPCPFVSCRYNLYLDVRNDGVLRLNFPDREPHEMTTSCALDLAGDGPRTLDIIAGLMGMSKERARQLERDGLMRVRKQFSPEDVDEE